jgi:tellurite resistance protein
VKQLAFLPVGCFGAAMGLSGLCSAWRLAHGLYGAPVWIGEFIGALAILAFIAASAAYSVKLARFPKRVAAEWNHPMIGPLFSTIFISLLLLPVVIAPYAPDIARAIWVLGAVSMACFTTFVVHRWLTGNPSIDHAAPNWFVPVVGAINIPAAGMFGDVPAVHEFYLLCVAVGLVFAIVLFTLVFARLVFRPALPPALQPALAILTAPFGVGFIGYTQTVGDIDLLASLLFYCGVFIFVVVAPVLLREACIPPFRLAWWSISFPFAALAVAGLRYARYARATDEPFTLWLGAILLAAVTLAIAWVLAQTLIHLLRGDLLAPEIAAAKAKAR